MKSTKQHSESPGSGLFARDRSDQGWMEEQRDLIQEALWEGEERLQALLDNSMTAVYLKDLQGRYLTINRWSEIMFRVAREEVVGKTDHELFPKEVADALRANDSKALEAEAPTRFEQLFLHEDGEYTYEATKFLLRDSAGNLYAVCGVATDVTELKRTEEALRESEERFRSLVQNASDTFMILGAEGIMRYQSPSVERVLGYPPEGLIGKNAFDYIHPDDAERVLGQFSSMVEGSVDRLAPVEYRFRHADGSWRYLESVGSNQLDNPNVGGIVTNSRDVTGRKRAEEALRESEERFRGAFEDAPIGVALVGLDRRYLRVNRALCEMLGYSEEELLAKTSPEVTHPDDREASEARTRRVLEEGAGSSMLEKRYVRADGQVVWVLSSISLVRDSGGDPSHFVSHFQDVTERKEAEESLRESEERYRAVMEQSAESILLFDAETKRVLQSNTASRELLGYSSEELREMTVYDFIAHEPDEIDSSIQRDLQEKRRFAGERKFRRKDGSLVDVEVSMAVIPYRGTEALCTVARDITERKALEERLRHRAFHDPLTELPNRALFLDRLQHALARSDRLRESVAVLFVDLDDFKLVNDSLGHDAGNLLLIEVGERLRTCVRAGDTVARLFGDEFAILLEAPAGVEEARLVAGRIGERLKTPLDLGGQEVFVSPSVGIALGETNENRPKDLLQRADVAMYTAKSRGKARHEIFDPSMDVHATKHLRLGNELRRAVERKEFELYYQPKLNLENGGIEGVEALVRWNHPDRGLVLPQEFIPLAEETGLIVPLGRWVIEEACRQAREWHDRYPTPLMMCVNLSTRQFRQEDLVEEISVALAGCCLEAGALVLEITETVMVGSGEALADKLEEIKASGIKLAIDDFGTGYSSLSHLKHFPVDYLKVDRSFVAGLGEDPGDAAIVSGITGLAHALGLKVIAEGVETADQLAELEELGCDMAQGFYFAEPLPSEAMSAFLADRHRRR